ncbi:MAG: hypothetical protein HKN11_04455 [Rhizobiales bacterium]|nr:hypothetical protein [Hyphomicrobiales bacterium]
MPAAWNGLKVGKVIEINGQLKRGDLGRLQKLVEDTGFSDCLRPGYCPFNNVISLNSSGGNFIEALKIAEYIAKQNFITLLARDAVCESACAMIFLGGYTKYEGFFFPRRFAHETASLGVHQPFIGVPEGTYSADQVGQVAKVINRGVNAATEYLLGAGAGIGLLRNMYATAPKSMYHLSVLEMSEQGIFVLGQNRDAGEVSRANALAYCAERYRARYFEVSPDLLDNMQSDQRTFLTFVAGQNFACMGVKDAGTGKWSVSICMGKTCWLAKYGQVEVGKYAKEKDFDDLMNIAVGLDNAELGIAIKDFRHRTVLLKYIRLFATDSGGSFRKLSAIEANLPMPKALCGRIDASDAGLVRTVQTALNQAGINVGRPDGSPGPGTRKGVQAANKKLLNRNVDQIDAALLRVLGLSDAEVADYTVCGG